MSQLLKKIIGPVRRQWRSKGFGVHSPFAYTYIRSVIRPPKGVRYYAEDEQSGQFARLLYRITAEALPDTIATFKRDSITPPDLPTYVAYGKADIAAMEQWARQVGHGVMFVSPRFGIYCCRSHIPYQRIEVAMPRPASSTQ